MTVMAEDFASAPFEPARLGVAIMRLSPLIISSGSLMCAWDQQNAFRSFLAPAMLKKPGHMSAHVLVDWFGEFARPTQWVIILFYPIALLCAFFNAWGAPGAGLHPHTKYFYTAGGILSILHFYFGAWSMMWNAKMASKDDIGKKNEEAVRGWLNNNGMRMVWVNLPAWIMFVCATVTFVRV